jgi:hypothetical protein
MHNIESLCAPGIGRLPLCDQAACRHKDANVSHPRQLAQSVELRDTWLLERLQQQASYSFLTLVLAAVAKQAMSGRNRNVSETLLLTHSRYLLSPVAGRIRFVGEYDERAILLPAQRLG